MRVLLWLRSLVFGRRLEREMREEMTAQLTRAVERFKAQGLSHADARRAARREFGNVEALRDEARDARGGQAFDSLAADLRFGLRQFARRPFSTLTMIAVLARTDRRVDAAVPRPAPRAVDHLHDGQRPACQSRFTA